MKRPSTDKVDDLIIGLYGKKPIAQGILAEGISFKERRQMFISSLETENQSEGFRCYPGQNPHELDETKRKL